MSEEPSRTPPLKILGSEGALPEAVARLQEGAEIAAIRTLEDVTHEDRPTVLVLTEDLLPSDNTSRALETIPGSVAILASGTEARRAAEKSGRLFMALDDLAAGDEAVLRLLRSAAEHSATRLSEERARAGAERAQSDLRELNRIGMALMSERDPDRLLNLILSQARRMTASDAGSLYLVEETEGEERLRFRLAQNDSLPDIPLPDLTLPLSEESLAGYAAVAREPLVIDDAYEIPDDAPYSFNRAFDEEFGYRAKSMLIVPMSDHRDRVVGVLQLINRKDDPEAVIRTEEDARQHVLSYREAEVEGVASLAGQAAVSIENGQLYQSIERLFEGFIKAAVTAIDQRDPTTSGHSVRVATLTCDLAEIADRTNRDPFGDVRFSREQMKELRYAGLLHDFGKVGVREEVLVKSKKLPPVHFERIESRFDLIRRTLEAEHHKKRADLLLRRGAEEAAEAIEALEDELRASLERVDRFQEAVREANEPRVLPEESSEILQEIRETYFPDFDGKSVPYLTDDELHFLAIPKGSLDPDERKQIESHVVHTYRFLLQIPWTEELSHVAEIARAHHEKLDGSGYPRGVTKERIPLQTRLMTASDIFDALTASDRPYKKAMPASRALEILEMEAREGQLDRGVVELMVESQAYRRILEEDWREL